VLISGFAESREVSLGPSRCASPVHPSAHQPAHSASLCPLLRTGVCIRLFFLDVTVCLTSPHSGQARRTPRLGFAGSWFRLVVAPAARKLVARRHHAGSGRFAHRSQRGVAAMGE